MKKYKNRFESLWDAMFGRILMVSSPGRLEDKIKRFRQECGYLYNRIEYHFNANFNQNKFNCPFHNSDRFTKLGSDYWRMQGHHLCCSYCGSWKPDQFMKHIKMVIKDGAKEYSVELADGRDKIYVHYPGLINCDDGAVKFFVAHLSKEDDRDLINKAIKISHEEFLKKLKRSKDENSK